MLRILKEQKVWLRNRLSCHFCVIKRCFYSFMIQTRNGWCIMLVTRLLISCPFSIKSCKENSCPMMTIKESAAKKKKTQKTVKMTKMMMTWRNQSRRPITSRLQSGIGKNSRQLWVALICKRFPVRKIKKLINKLKMPKLVNWTKKLIYQAKTAPDAIPPLKMLSRKRIHQW